MKKIFIVLGLLLICYLVLLAGYRFYGKGHKYEYNVRTNEQDFAIYEEFNNIKSNPNYYFKILINGETFYYQTYENFNNKSKIIKDVYYFDNNKYKCILPIFTGDRIISDILCKNSNDHLYFYHNIYNVNNELDEFANSLSKIGYNQQNWIDTANANNNDEISWYYDNFNEDSYFGLTNYKGIILFNAKSNKLNRIDLFTTDVYQKKIDFVYKNKYVVADYNSKLRFHNFNVIDLITGTQSSIISAGELSFDAYIQGIISNKVYLFDRSLKKQYEIDVDQETAKEIGNENIGIKIYNNKTNEWEIVSATVASNKNLIFDDSSDIVNDRFEKVNKIGNDLYGYYFYYQKVDNKYLVYRSNVQNDSQLTYIFTTSSINSVIYFYDAIYFEDDEYIYKYSDSTGIKKILKYNELKFNENLHFFAYSK